MSENEQDTMTLRDQFAMAVLLALLALNCDYLTTEDVKSAYAVADAMLAERARLRGPKPPERTDGVSRRP